MAKKQKDAQETKKENKQNPVESKPIDPIQEQLERLPKDVQDKIKELKIKLDKYKDEVLKKFDKYIMGISLLPPPKPKEGEQINKDRVDLFILVDDRDSQKMSKLELKDKLAAIMENIAKENDKNIFPQTIILSELWQNCYDGKSEMLALVAMGAPLFDRGMLQAIKIAEIHKNMVLKKFEKYIVSYVLAGSLTQGKATPTSDIDVWIVIDDTDVKKMTRAELKDKLRAIIIGMGLDAGDMTGIRNKLNIQVYILTDFWDSLREANPIIYTLLRDGVPFYDRGIFMPWKQLLRMGKIKPSPESIDMFMHSGEQMIQRVRARIKEIGMEDTYYAILTPSQAAIMMHGVAPPTPRETPDVMEEMFVKKLKLLEPKWIEILRKNIQIRKELEHGTKKDLSGKEVDELLQDAEDYLQRVKKLFGQIEEIKEKDTMLHVYETIITMIRDCLRMEGVEKVSDVEIIKVFEQELVHTGRIPEKFLRILNEVIKAKKDYDANKLTRADVQNVKKNANELIKFIVEYMQRKRGRELERARIRVKHGNRYGEVLLFDDVAFIIHDKDQEEKEISKAPIEKDGGLGTTQKSSLEELEQYLAKVEIPPKVFIKQPIFEDLKNIFGKDVEILLNY
ncbi:nucleotidyltransferase domain-containing protein [Candidatus Woesearchaeota archaeon]|nr:nucleotidyltransferase domain-containing protein [Candidatus Woesearchaeota archaeon]